ncbi:hypothetical protein NUU61_007332 [Penicillium alfredii]|uniref:Transmembrane protein n=1 Tax=Penicillium alfredii TaxID=1506179 RepID=A0A9W9K535_9EURO|nr:uncharacterized protein NUU61_007332 [Penicillium alfredii]KAJ5092462.1 hypothetical protein NUU61_007332 [Penicillium alfredii]
MSHFAVPSANKPYRNHPTGPSLRPRNGRWYIPLVAAIGLGFGAYNYYVEAMSRRNLMAIEEEKRVARNQQLMDAYGDKNSLDNVQHALETYKGQ